ncbi:hybrid sensor histidine kinase/response regulator transcription factor [Mucilaginibacter lacusdianchii]|uniref:hybrid sensor histidine kinase/response regulator transcription factor n=1 Tax=Mucilaginibacter lacusdianchii TaxID=2684211 RepID=UPI00131C460D|nr:hybrid sensor histidine kinase/response regulator transcription factor [Mucilaginibacter sp. JXJ CY 39]
MKPNSFTYLIILVLQIYICNAQPYYFKHYQVENGLSNNTVHCILQDRRGFLWMGTKDGLNCFDGYTFRVFRHNPKDKNSIEDNIVHTLSLDQKGGLWVGTDKGLDKYDFDKETFVHIKTATGKQVASIAHDAQNNTWFTLGTSLMMFDKRGKLTDYSPYQHFEATSIAYANNSIWVSTAAGTIERLKSRQPYFTSYNLFSHSKWVASNHIETIYSAGNKKILVGTTNQGAKEFNCVDGTYKDLLTYKEDHTEIYVRNFLKVSNQKVWIATESGIYIYNTQTGSFTHLKKSYNDPYSLSDNAIYALYKDKEGGVWAGTYFGGLNYYSQQYSIFNKFYPGSDDENSLKGNVVREICKDSHGNMWLGTEDHGLNKLSADKRTWTHYCPNGSNGLSNTNIHGLMPNGDELFIGTFERGLDVLDINSGKVKRVYLAGKDSNELKSNFIMGFCRTRSGVILTGTTKGLYQYRNSSKDFHLISKIPQDAFIYAIQEDFRGNIWLGTVNEGLYYYNPKQDIGRKVKFKSHAKVLERATINGLFEDSNHKMWLATEGLGLWNYNPESGSYKCYNIENGFPSNHIYKILEDTNKNLWISTSHGLVCLNLSKNSITVYTKANGLLSDQFNYNSAFKDTDGTLYFGCVKGMISFNPAAFKQDVITYPVYITGLQINNKDVTVKGRDSLLNQSINHIKQIKLNHNQSSFSIDFAALNFSSPEMTRYQYKMKGLDNGWTELKRNRKVYFTQLSPGHYTFMVKAVNSSNEWDSKVTKLEIYIAPPIWESFGAYVLYILIGLLVIYYLFKRYHLKIRQKHERFIELLNHDKEKQIYTAKIEFFTNIAHEIRTPLTLIKGPMENIIKELEVVPNVQDNLKMMEKNTNRLLELTNQLLDFRKTELDGYRLNFVRTDIGQLLADIFSQFKSLADSKNIVFTLKQPDENVYAYVDVDAFMKIITNLIGNAVKYGYSVVEIELMKYKAEDKTFTIEFKNDGYLIPFEMREKIFEPFFRMKVAEKHTGTGIGLPLSRSLTELHKGILTLGEPVDNLNIVLLSLPIHQDYEFDFTVPGVNTVQPDADSRDILDTSTKPVILLVDDNPEILEFISRELRDKYAVVKARNGQEAINHIGSKNVQLIVSDVMMPVMDGFELCKKIKTNLAYSHIPIVLLTAKSTLQNKIEGLDIGADAYLEKPFSPDYLLVQIANLLSNREKIKEHFASSPVTSIKSIAHSKADEKFLEKLNAIICENIQNTDLDVELIASLMNMSRPTLFRKIKAVSNLTLNELVNITRLKAAANLLEEGTYKIYEIANMVGYNSQSQLGRNFLKHFGTTPTDYQQNKQKVRVNL